jgi:hypothetical protein
MKAIQLRALIEHVLSAIGAKTNEAVDLLMLTAAQESNLGEYITQRGGPALGIFQMEPATLYDLYNNYLRYFPSRADFLKSFRTACSLEMDLTGNLLFQIAAARMQYLRKKGNIPVKKDYGDDYGYVESLAKYWKKHWNTDLGRGTVAGAVQKYYKYVIKGEEK